MSGTYTGVQIFVRTRAAENFAKKYMEVVKAPSEAEAFWYSLHPLQRKDKTPIQVLQEFDSAKTKERMMVDQKAGPVRALRKRLAASKDEVLHFVKIQDVGQDESRGAEVTIYAVAIFEVEGPGNKDFPEKQQYAAAIFKGTSKGRQYEWWVDDMKFPYYMQAIAPPVAKPADDGHGHAH
jgi:hypothetical protein